MQLPEKFTTERLTIRKFKPEDKSQFISFMTDEEATKYLEYSATQKTPEGAAHLLDFILDSYDTDEPVFSMAIESHKHGYIGFCGIAKIDDETWECYFGLNREFRGKGFATEAVELVIGWCRKILAIKELRAYLHIQDSDSENVVNRLGMKNQGIQPHPILELERKLFTLDVSV